MRGISIVETFTILPVVIAVIMFFLSISVALNIVDEKNRKIDMVMSMLELVDKVSSFMPLDEEKIEDMRKILEGSISTQFVVCIKDVDKRSCEYEIYSTLNYEAVKRSKDLDKLAYVFPVAFQIKKDDIPFNEVKEMVVIVWQRV